MGLMQHEFLSVKFSTEAGYHNSYAKRGSDAGGVCMTAGQARVFCALENSTHSDAEDKREIGEDANVSSALEGHLQQGG